VRIPHIGAGDSAIEDLFDEETINTKIKGKTFNRENRKSSETEYGKTVFAEKVIRANQETINFNGFRNLLDRFKMVIDDYRETLEEIS
jgi:hypothetical protein